MAKFLRILPAQQTTTTNGPILLDPDSILVMQASSSTVCRLIPNNIDGNADIIDVTFSPGDNTFIAHRNFCEAICAASSDQKSTIYDMPPIIGGDGLVRTITSIAYS